MHCGYLSLRHNWNTKSLRYCWILSLMITETSTTLSRKSTPRKLFLPLLPPPRQLGRARGQRLCADLVDPALLLRRPESTRHSEQLLRLLHTQKPRGNGRRRSPPRRPSHPPETAWPATADKSTGTPACSETSCSPGSLRAAGCVPGGGVFCPCGASCASCTTSSPTLAIFGPLGSVVRHLGQGHSDGHPLMSQP